MTANEVLARLTARSFLSGARRPELEATGVKLKLLPNRAGAVSRNLCMTPNGLK